VYSLSHTAKARKSTEKRSAAPSALRSNEGDSGEDGALEPVEQPAPEVSNEAIIDVVLAIAEEDNDEFQYVLNQWIEELEAEDVGGESVIVEQPSFHKLVVTVAKENADDVIDMLVQKSLVLSVEFRPDFIFLNRWATLVTQVPDGSHHPIWEKGITGQGEVVACADTGLDYDSCYFRDDTESVSICEGNGARPDCINHNHRKVVTYRHWSYTNVGDANNGHGTHVIGSIAGSSGNSNNNGLAPDAKIAVDDISPSGSSLRIPGDLSSQMFPHSYQAGARLHSNSWGSSTSHYTSTSREMDEFMYDHDDYLILVANGNSGSNTGTVGSPATAKNVLSVGAGLNMRNNDPGRAQRLASFSSRGPTFDGRIKPDVVCPGSALVSARSDEVLDSNQCTTSTKQGTSMATPICAGGAALVRQYFTQGFAASGVRDDTKGFMPSGTLVKAMMIQSGQPMQNYETLPNVHVGFGRVDLSAVLWFADSTFKLSTLDREEVTQGASNEYCYSLQSQSQFKVSLVWTDKEGPTYSEKALLQDLDLVVIDAQGNELLGNGWEDENGAAVRDDRNNVEQVTINQAVAGTYKVKILGADLPEGPQKYSIVVTGDIASCAAPAPQTTLPAPPSPPQTTPTPPAPSPTNPPVPAPPTTRPPVAPPVTTSAPPAPAPPGTTPTPPGDCAEMVAAPGSPFSGKVKPEPIVSDAGVINVNFTSDNSKNFNGFLASFGPAMSLHLHVQRQARS